jgi:hypothetical protein
MYICPPAAGGQLSLNAILMLLGTPCKCMIQHRLSTMTDCFALCISWQQSGCVALQQCTRVTYVCFRTLLKNVHGTNHLLLGR